MSRKRIEQTEGMAGTGPVVVVEVGGGVGSRARAEAQKESGR